MDFWDQFGVGMSSKLPSLTLDTFKYARALVSWTVQSRCDLGFGLWVGWVRMLGLGSR
jgi:hypothetical protein